MKHLICVAAVAFPALLLFPVGQGFQADWTNHVWMVGYFGEYFRQHGAMPWVINTDEVGGMAYPVFYGYLFYQLLGPFAAWLHPEIVVRLAAALLIALQFVVVRNTLRRQGADALLAATAACLVVWAVYALTNLYNRSALPEFFAVGFLTCAVCFWFDLLLAEDRRAVWRRTILFVSCLVLTAGTHPITAVGGLAVGGLLLPALALRPAGPSLFYRLGVLAAVGLLGAVTLAPWVRAVLKFEPYLQIHQTFHTPEHLYYYPDSLDAWYTRLFPLPVDWRSLPKGPAEVSTVHLDAQINVPLAVLCVAVVAGLWRGWDRRRRTLAVCFLAPPVLYGAFVGWLSVHPPAFHYVPRIFLSVQIVYRMVSYVNFGMLLTLLYACCYARSAGPGGRVAAGPVLCAVVLTLAGCGVAVKLLHGACAGIPDGGLAAVWQKYGKTYTTAPGPVVLRPHRDYRRGLTRLPLSFMGYYPYTMETLYPPLSGAEQKTVVFAGLSLDPGGRFGDGGRAVVRLGRDGFVGTDLLRFPWNRVRIDGQLVPPNQLRSWTHERFAPRDAPRFAVPVPAGEHVLEYEFIPSPGWRRWRVASNVSFLAWLGLLGWVGVAQWRRRKDPAAAPAQESTLPRAA
jgi:hypothetical protein